MVLGDELIAMGLAKYLALQDGVTSVEVYGPGKEPGERIDLMLYMNDQRPLRQLADRHVIYLQNPFSKGAERALESFHERGYDGYVLYARRLHQIHESMGKKGLFLPFGVDLELYHPQPPDERYAFDCVYVGNDIKGEERTSRYLLPAIDHGLTLYGSWVVKRLSAWRWFKQSIGVRKYDHGRPYQKSLANVSRGPIPVAELPALYSSAAISLNFTHADSVAQDVFTLRTLEVLACKGFLITDRVPVAEEELQGCVVFTDGGDDLKDKIAYYLERPEERGEIAERGYQYAVDHASIEARARQLWEYLASLA